MRAKQRSPHFQQGFSLLEALIAIVITALVISSISQWLSTAINTSKSVENTIKVEEVYLQALSHLELIDMKSQREGSLFIQDIEVRWQATAVRESQNEFFVRQPNFNVVLFDIRLSFFVGEQRIKDVNTKLVKQWLL